jgi:hypothetical protein
MRLEKEEKKFTLNDIYLTWLACYGEDIFEEYEGFVELLMLTEKARSLNSREIIKNGL